MLLTGDKDFLESSVKDPRIVSVREFLDTDFGQRIPGMSVIGND